MADLSTHYKEISPEQTIQNITNFFEKNGFTLKYSLLEETEATTWHCHIDLFYDDDILISGSNGKGVNKEYCMASGLAEMYERFCNGQIFLPNPYWNRTLIDINMREKGYHLRSNEKMLSYDEVLNNSQRIYNYYNTICNGIPVLIKNTIDYITNQQYIGIPYKNIDGSDELYVDPRVLIRTTCSIGMAAGNTVTEALIQALSELAEQRGQKRFFENIDIPHYAIKLETITDVTLQHMLTKIKEQGYTVYLFDLSYNFQVPTIMSLIIDRKNGSLNLNFGSFPVFEIAAERVITELYQGMVTFNDPGRKSQIQIPTKSLGNNYVFNQYANGISGEYFFLDFFNTIEYVESYNKEIFVDKNVSNEELLQYFCKLAKKLDVKFYYLDNSLCDKMKAVQVFMEGQEVFDNLIFQDMYWNYANINSVITHLNQLRQLYNEIYTRQDVDLSNLLKIIEEYTMFNSTVANFLGYICMWHDFTLSSNSDLNFSSLLLLLDNGKELTGIPIELTSSILYKNYKKYLNLFYYIQDGAYSKEEILNLFNKIFDWQITEKDIDNYLNHYYLLQKVYVEPLMNYIHSKKYQKMIKTFTNTPSQ